MEAPHGPPYSRSVLEAERFRLEVLDAFLLSAPKTWGAFQTSEGASQFLATYATDTSPSWNVGVRLFAWSGENAGMMHRAKIYDEHASSILSGAESPGFIPFVSARRMDGFFHDPDVANRVATSADLAAAVRAFPDPDAEVKMFAVLNLPFAKPFLATPWGHLVHVVAAVESLHARGIVHGRLAEQGSLIVVDLAKAEPQIFAFGAGPKDRFAFYSNSVVLVAPMGLAPTDKTREDDVEDVLRLFGLHGEAETLEDALKIAVEHSPSLRSEEAASKAAAIGNLFVPGRPRSGPVPDLVEITASLSVSRAYDKPSLEEQRAKVGKVRGGLGNRILQKVANAGRSRSEDGESRLLYPGEHHVAGHNYTGPGTRTNYPWVSDYPPKNRVDACSREHDLEYDRTRYEPDPRRVKERKRNANIEAANCIERYPRDAGYLKTKLVLAATTKGRPTPKEVQRMVDERLATASTIKAGVKAGSESNGVRDEYVIVGRSDATRQFGYEWITRTVRTSDVAVGWREYVKRSKILDLPPHKTKDSRLRKGNVPEYMVRLRDGAQIVTDVAGIQNGEEFAATRDFVEWIDVSRRKPLNPTESPWAEKPREPREPWTVTANKLDLTARRRACGRVPPVEIDELNFTVYDDVPGLEITVVRDDKLCGGTKSRAVVQHLQNIMKDDPLVDEFVYVTSWFGGAQIALAWGVRELNKALPIGSPRKKAILFTRDPGGDVRPYTQVAMDMGAEFHFAPSPSQAAADYVEKRRGRAGGAWLLNSGFKSSRTVDVIAGYARKVAEEFGRFDEAYCAVGSGTLIQGLVRGQLARVYHGVCVFGTCPKLTLLKGSPGQGQMHMHNHRWPFEEPAPRDLYPPFPSASRYDAKVWRYVLNTERSPLIHTPKRVVMWNVM
jgi:hypothetical protein